MGWLGQAVVISGGRISLVVGQLRGDESDERLFIEHAFFGDSPLSGPLYRAVSKSVFDTAPVLQAVVGRKGTPEFFEDPKLTNPISIPPVINLGKERALLTKVYTIDSSNRGRGSGFTIPELQQYIGDQVPVVEIVRDTSGAFVETIVHGYAKTTVAKTEENDLKGVILPRWNPTKKEAGGRQCVWLFGGASGLALLRKNESRFVTPIEEVRED